MLPQINRLKKRKQFNYIFKNGQYCSCKLLTLIFIKTKGKNYKLGFSVSKKVGNAVVRNKVKRRMREAVRSFRKSIKNDYTYIIVAKPEIVNSNFLEIKQNIIFLFEKMELLINET